MAQDGLKKKNAPTVKSFFQMLRFFAGFSKLFGSPVVQESPQYLRIDPESIKQICFGPKMISYKIDIRL